MKTTLRLKDFYSDLGRLAECPGESFAGLLESCRKGLAELCPEGSASLALFQKAIAPFSRDQVEEAYLRAFDITPLAVPYLSIHLFGEENYRRGEFMARLLEAYGKAGLDCGGELPDHLSILLQFAAKLEGEERRELLEFCLTEPLQKMEAPLKRAGHPYEFLLQAIRDVVETDLKREVCHA